ncbi:MAG: molybdopterin-dependent oxidoreductase alpha subunit [Candidatus Endobugula sp.]|jgi:molybdopterin-dependent oxidoreductase alpha subunit
MKTVVGGGVKKVLYTLNTIKRIGLEQSAKALRANNACKACGLGMGGQQGGMTNELGEFPSVCNKSIQAQSTDIQPPIPKEIFHHSLDELRELSPKELENMGRLGNPIYKPKGASHFQPVDWDWCLQYAAERFAASEPARSFFYSSGRSSNESGFVLQLLARLYGTNNVNNCSYYCHQATSVGLTSTIGTGTSTIELADLSHCDLIFVIGANPASNHPRFIHQLKNCRDRGGQVIVINPAKEPGLVKFAVPKSAHSMIVGGTEIASFYLQPKIGSDIALFKGIAKAVLEQSAEDNTYIDDYVDYFAAFKEDVNNTSWDTITSTCGIEKEQIVQAATLYSRSSNAVFAWGMGMTHHAFGSENVEYIANLALLRGMVGKPYSGLLPLRGHSNVQGIGTIGVKPVLAEAVFEKLEQYLGSELPRSPGLDTFHALEAAHQGKIDCACIVGGNLYSASPNSKWAAEALNRIGFKVFLTTTLNQGHLYGADGESDNDVLILPVQARDEEKQSTTQESMFNYVRLSDGGIDRLDNVRSEVSILASIGKKLLALTQPNSPVDFSQFERHDTIREAIAKTIPGMEDLEDISVAKKEFHVRQRIMHTPVFKTPNQKAAFVVHNIPARQRVTTVDEDNTQDYPFLLASVRSEGQFNSIIYEETDSYRFNAPRDAVFLSRIDMQVLDLATGDRVDVISPTGTMVNVVVQQFDLPQGSVMAYYPEANVLAEHHLDPRSLTPNFKSIAVRVVKVMAL